MLLLLPEQEILTLWPGDADTEDGWVSTAWAQHPGRGRDRDDDSGVQTRENGAGPVCLHRAPPLSRHPVTWAESDQGEEQRGSGRGGHGQGVLPLWPHS